MIKIAVRPSWGSIWAVKLRPSIMRRPNVVGIVRNGATKRVYQCFECGRTISMNAKYRVPKCVQAFIVEHNEECAKRAVLRDLDGSLASLVSL
jgi:hypothetical protein